MSEDKLEKFHSLSLEDQYAILELTSAPAPSWWGVIVVRGVRDGGPTGWGGIRTPYWINLQRPIWGYGNACS